MSGRGPLPMFAFTLGTTCVVRTCVRPFVTSLAYPPDHTLNRETLYMGKGGFAMPKATAEALVRPGDGFAPDQEPSFHEVSGQQATARGAPPVRVLLVARRPVTRAGMCSILASAPKLRVVSAVS